MDSDAVAFLPLVAHAAILFCVVLHRVDYVKSSLPEQVVNEGQTFEPYNKDMEVSLVIVISLSLAAVCLEMLFFFLRQGLQHPPFVRTFSLTCHSLGCTALLKLAADQHPVGHFWIVFGLFSAPSVLLQTATFLVLR